MGREIDERRRKDKDEFDEINKLTIKNKQLEEKINAFKKAFRQVEDEK